MSRKYYHRYNIIHKMHPFADGNGRICCLLVTWHCRRVPSLVLIYDEQTAQAWQDAVSSQTPHKLSVFINRSVQKVYRPRTGVLRRCNWHSIKHTTHTTVLETTTTIPIRCVCDKENNQCMNYVSHYHYFQNYS